MNTIASQIYIKNHYDQDYLKKVYISDDGG